MPKKIPAILGLSTTYITDEEKDFLQNKNIYGFILFKRNIQTEDQLQELVNNIHGIVAGDPVIFIDQEGGRVLRLVPPLVDYTYPSAGYFSKFYDDFGKEYALPIVQKNYANLMSDLKAFNIDVTCAPVADLRIKGAHDVIGDRSFGSDNEIIKVIELCQAAINGIKSVGGNAVIKHLPGHGRASADSHLDLPIVNVSLAELMDTDFAVFKQLSNYNQDIYAMTAHIVYTALDRDNPATLSTKVISFIREEIGFQGKIMSDDICMKALHKNIDFNDHNEYLANLADLAVHAYASGCDLILHCSGNLDEMVSVVGALEAIIDAV